MNDQILKITALLERIAQALETSAGTAAAAAPQDWNAATAFLWRPEAKTLKLVTDTGALPLDLLVGIAPQIETLLNNTRQFAQGFSANNALLWGARGSGKSSLVKSIHAELAKTLPLKLIEIYRGDIASLPDLLDILRDAKDNRFILFCDDLSFDEQDDAYKSLKAILEGGVEPRPDNVILYATSNRRHLLARNMIENEREVAIHASESVEEKVSLSDRFGLWLGFYPCNQDDYLTMIRNYAARYDLKFDDAAANEWFRTRGSRSGRVAWQFIQHVAGRQGKKLA